MYKSTSRFLQHSGRKASPVRKPPPRQARRRCMARIKSAQAQGQSLHGYVKSVTPSGTFVSLGVLEGFLPIREIRGELRPGMAVQVVVIHIDEERKRIVLSMRHGESTS